MRRVARETAVAAIGLVVGIAVLGVAPAHAQAPAPAAPDSPSPPVAAADAWRFDLGGRLQLDHDTFRGQYSTSGRTASTGYLRRGRIELSARRGDWRVDLDLEPLEDGPAWLDKLFVTYSGWRPLRVTAGRFKPDFGLEQMTSSKWTTAIERSAIWDLAPDANDYTAGGGVQLSTYGTRYHGSVGLYRKREHSAQAARVAWAPWLTERSVGHLGLSVSREDIDDGNGRIRSRLGVQGVTESGQGERTTLASSLRDGFDSDRAFVLEAALRHGPWSLQAEFLQRRLGGIGAAPTRQARGHYVQLAWTVTGEVRPYDIDGASFGAIRPDRAGLGAWEVFARRDWLEVSGDGRSIGDGSGRASAWVWAAGLNWYPERRFKLSAAMLWSRSHGVETEAGTNFGRALSLRAQMAF